MTQLCLHYTEALLKLSIHCIKKVLDRATCVPFNLLWQRDSTLRCFPRRTEGPEMWAGSHSCSLPPFKKKSHVRVFLAADFNPQVILCSSKQCAGGGEGMIAVHAAVPPAWKGRWAAVPLFRYVGSLWPTATVQRSDLSRALWRAETPHADSTHMVPTPRAPHLWARTCGKSPPWQESRARHTALSICPAPRFPQGYLCTPAGKERGSHETSSGLDTSMSTPTYRARPTSSAQSYTIAQWLPYCSLPVPTTGAEKIKSTQKNPHSYTKYS